MRKASSIRGSDMSVLASGDLRGGQVEASARFRVHQARDSRCSTSCAAACQLGCRGPFAIRNVSSSTCAGPTCWWRRRRRRRWVVFLQQDPWRGACKGTFTVRRAAALGMVRYLHAKKRGLHTKNSDNPGVGRARRRSPAKKRRRGA